MEGKLLGRVGKIAFVEAASDFAVGQGATSGDILCNIDVRSNADRREKRREIGGMEFTNTPDGLSARLGGSNAGDVTIAKSPRAFPESCDTIAPKIAANPP